MESGQEILLKSIGEIRPDISDAEISQYASKLTFF